MKITMIEETVVDDIMKVSLTEDSLADMKTLTMAENISEI
jgi:hypothetical protein